MTEKNLFGLCKLQTSINGSYRFLYIFANTHSSFIIQLHPTTPSNFSFTIFPFFFYFSLQRCIICAKLFYRLKKTNSMHRVWHYTFLYWIQGIAFMFIFVGIYFFYFLKKALLYSPRKSELQNRFMKRHQKSFSSHTVSQICNNLKSFLFEHYGNHVM